MIENTNLISDIDGYKKYNYFEISDELENILSADYNKYNKDSSLKQDFIDDLYKINFEDKYNKEENKEIFQLYIDNQEFKDKTKFIYSIIDYDKYASFVSNNKELDNPGKLTIKYSIKDSDGVKVQIYHISIVDISFVF
jgi:transposase